MKELPKDGLRVVSNPRERLRPIFDPDWKAVLYGCCT